jgi:hypothetical protein
VTGEGYAIQGNILVGEGVVAAMQSAFAASDTAAPFAERLLAALRAGDAAGGDARSRQSAALLVVRNEAGFDGGDDIESSCAWRITPAPSMSWNGYSGFTNTSTLRSLRTSALRTPLRCSPRWTPVRKP